MAARKTKRRSWSRFSKFVAGAQWCSVGGLWLSAASQYVSPATFRYAAVMGLSFPVWLVGTAFFLVFSLLFARRTAWISALGLLSCVMSIRCYVPVNLPSPPPRRSIRVLTYNTMQFGAAAHDEHDRNAVAAYMLKSDADIICYQEGHTTPKEWEKYIIPLLRKTYPYRDTTSFASYNNLGCFSKYPIVSSELVYRTGFNASLAYKIVCDGGDTLLVVNNHFASNRLNPEDRKIYKQMVKDPEDAPMKRGVRLLVKKVTDAAVLRAGQADSVSKYIATHRQNYPVIVCGDFNDTPISYCRKKMAKGMTDAYVATGMGVGRSFNRDAIFVRIDNMFCSPDLKPYGAHVDNSINVSDHYPLYCNFKRITEDK